LRTYERTRTQETRRSVISNSRSGHEVTIWERGSASAWAARDYGTVYNYMALTHLRISCSLAIPRACLGRSSLAARRLILPNLPSLQSRTRRHGEILRSGYIIDVGSNVAGRCRQAS